MGSATLITTVKAVRSNAFRKKCNNRRVELNIVRLSCAHFVFMVVSSLARWGELDE